MNVSSLNTNLIYNTSNPAPVVSQSSADAELQTSDNASSEQSKIDKYKEIVNSSVDKTLSQANIEPSEGEIYFWETTYKENNFNCAKHNNWNGTSKIVKVEQLDFCGVVCGVLFGDVPEKIIEDYDKDGNLVKKTYYKTNNNYIVTSYNKDGSKKDEAEVKSGVAFDGSYYSNLVYKSFDKEGNYCQVKQTYTMSDKTSQQEPEITTSMGCYDKNGKFQLINTIIDTALWNCAVGVADIFLNQVAQ